MQFLGRVVRYINITGGVLAGVAMVLMMAHITIEVSGRYFFNARMVGTLEVVSFYYMVILVFLGFGYVESRREHIRVDLFVQMMPVPVQFLLYVFACLLGLWFFGMLFWQSLHDALTGRADGDGPQRTRDGKFPVLHLARALGAAHRLRFAVPCHPRQSPNLDQTAQGALGPPQRGLT